MELAGDVMAAISLVLNAGWFLYGRILRTRFTIDPFVFMLVDDDLGRDPRHAAHADRARLALDQRPGTVLRGVHDDRGHGRARADDLGSSVRADVGLVAATPRRAAARRRRRVGVLRRVARPIEIIGSAVVVGSLWGVVRSPELEEAEHDIADPTPPT